MGQKWMLSTDLLARSRFVVSPFSETVAALMILSRPDPPGTPWIRSFRALHREACLGMLAEDKLRAVVAGHMWRPRRGQVPGWIADFLGLPPLGCGATFADELGQLVAWDDDRIRDEIRQHAAGPLSAALGRPGLRNAVADMLRWVWTTTLASDWPRRRRVLEADILTRTSRLASYGWAGVFGTLSPSTSWHGGGRRSTTQLAALTGLPPGAVGNHLRVLLEAGAVLRWRAGREVLYWRTSLGDALAAPGR